MIEKRSSHELLCAKCGKEFALEMIEKRDGNMFSSAAVSLLPSVHRADGRTCYRE